MRLRFSLAVAWTVLILALCLSPKGWMPQKQEPSVKIPHLDKVVHGVLFAGFGVLWLGASRSPSRYGKVIVAGLALAIATELGQDLPIVARDCSLMDGVADFAGLLLGVFAYRAGTRCLVVYEPSAVAG